MPTPDQIKFSVPDDMFDADGTDDEPSPLDDIQVDASESDPPEPTPSLDDDDEPPVKTKNAEPKADESAGPLPDLDPATFQPEADVDDAVRGRLEAVELRARLEELERRQAEAPRPDPTADRRRDLISQRDRAREQVFLAVRDGDEETRLRAQYALQDADRELDAFDHEQRMRSLQGQDRQAQPQQQRMTQDQVANMQADTFNRVNRVTYEEQVQAQRAWQELVQRDPRWTDPNIPLTNRMSAALKIVRSRNKPAHAPAMAGGTHVAGGGPSGAISESEIRDAMIAFGESRQNAIKIIKAGRDVQPYMRGGR